LIPEWRIFHVATAGLKKTVLITGTSTGIGRLTALTCARSGHLVYAGIRDSSARNASSAADLRDLARRESITIHVIDLDVTSQDSIEAALQRIEADGNSLDVLVNNAGHMSIGIAEAFTEEQIRQQFEVNTFAPIRLSKAVLPAMRRRRAGLIVHVSSIVGRVLFPGCAFYCASKFALEAFAEVLNYELTGFSIDSVIVEPGPFGTHLLANSPGPNDKETVAAYEQLSTMRDTFVAQFASFFASDQAPDPQMNADAILALIEMPAGKRPLRTVCGIGYGTEVLNQQNAPLQAKVLRDIGMGFLEHRTGINPMQEV
jgi:NAD(P)-dependent dehydrogenase (short-subunit alcohol dehydrogenase family)